MRLGSITTMGDLVKQLRWEIQTQLERPSNYDRRVTLNADDVLALLPGRFNPTEDDARELVAAANQRAESIAQRLMAAQRYATDKGDLELARRLAIPEPHSSS